MTSIVTKVKARLAKYRAGRPECRRRQAKARTHRLEMKRRHESDPGAAEEAGASRAALGS